MSKGIELRLNKMKGRKQSAMSNATNDSELKSGNRKVRFLPVKEFEKQLRTRVNEYFSDNNISKRDSRKMYRKTSIVLVWLVLSYSF